MLLSGSGREERPTCRAHPTARPRAGVHLVRSQPHPRKCPCVRATKKFKDIQQNATHLVHVVSQMLSQKILNLVMSNRKNHLLTSSFVMALCFRRWFILMVWQNYVNFISIWEWFDFNRIHIFKLFTRYRFIFSIFLKDILSLGPITKRFLPQRF